MPERRPSNKPFDEMQHQLWHHHELLHAIKEGITSMSAALDRITREVAESRSATQSLITLVGGLAQQIRDLKDDPAALEALADDLDSQQAEIASAVSANTPQE